MLNISPQLLPHFKGFCSSPSVIMLFVYMKCRFSLSYRDLEEMMMIRGAKIDHATLQRWLKRFVSLIECARHGTYFMGESPCPGGEPKD